MKHTRLADDILTENLDRTLLRTTVPSLTRLRLYANVDIAQPEKNEKYNIKKSRSRCHLPRIRQ